MTVEPGSAVPVSTGVVTEVRLSFATPVSDRGDKTAIGGVAGALVSMVRFSTTDAAEVLPAASVDLTVSGWTPLVSTVDV